VGFNRRAMHASSDSPCHLLAKHHVLRACFPLMAPFRTMLLTGAEWSALLRPKGSLGTCIPKGVGPHSYTPLSRRTKAKPYGWRAKGTRASLDSARHAAGVWPPPGRKMGWGGAGQSQAGRQARVGGAPVGRGAAPYRAVAGGKPAPARRGRRLGHRGSLARPLALG
jgi:hypothetical protein